MPRVSIDKLTGLLIEGQGNDDAPLDALRANAIRAGHLDGDIETTVVSEAELAGLIKALEPEPTYEEARRATYPPEGDQLDVLWKQFNQDRLGGKALIQEADDMLGLILSVKAAHPKPE